MTQIKITVTYLLEVEENMSEIQLLDLINKEVSNLTSQPTIFTHTKNGSEVSIKDAQLIDSAIPVYEKSV